MRFCQFGLALLLAASSGSSVRAEDTAKNNQPSSNKVSYKVRFSAVQNSCEKSSGEDLGKETVTLTVDASGGVRLAIRDLPPLIGKLRKGGKFSAKAEQKKESNKSRQGKYRVVGRKSEGKLRLLLISEFYKDGEPDCTQSWNGE